MSRPAGRALDQSGRNSYEATAQGSSSGIAPVVAEVHARAAQDGLEAFLSLSALRPSPSGAPAKLKLGRQLGQGSFATVHKGVHKSRVVAVKVLRPDYVTHQPVARMLLKEAQLLSSLNHPNIARCRGICLVPPASGHGSGAPAMLMDYYECGSLGELILKQMRQPREQLYSDVEGLTWLLQVADALVYLHCHDPAIIHRDVKPANVMLASITGKGGPGSSQSLRGIQGQLLKHRMEAKLCDFGLHQVVRPVDHRPMLRVASQVAHASHSGIFHTPRMSEDGSLLLPPALFDACERLWGPLDPPPDLPQASSVSSDSGFIEAGGGADGLSGLVCRLARTQALAGMPAASETHHKQQPQVLRHQQQYVMQQLNRGAVIPPALAPQLATARFLRTSSTGASPSVAAAAVAALAAAAAAYNTVAQRHQQHTLPPAQGPLYSSGPQRLVEPGAGAPQGPATASTLPAAMSAAEPLPAPPPLLLNKQQQQQFAMGSTDISRQRSINTAGAPAHHPAAAADSSQPSHRPPPPLTTAFGMAAPIAAAGGPSTVGSTAKVGPTSAGGPTSVSPTSAGAPAGGDAAAPSPLPDLRPIRRHMPISQQPRSYSFGVGGPGTRTSMSGGGPSGASGRLARRAAYTAADSSNSEGLGVVDIPFLERVFPLSGQCGSSIYMSPEVAQELPYNEKADVFSFAVMCYEVISRTLISKTAAGRDGTGFTRMMVEGKRPTLPPQTDSRVASLIRACWHSDPLERPSMNQVVSVLQRVLYGDNIEASGTDAITGYSTAASSKSVSYLSRVLSSVSTTTAPISPVVSCGPTATSAVAAAAAAVLGAPINAQHGGHVTGAPPTMAALLSIEGVALPSNELVNMADNPLTELGISCDTGAVSISTSRGMLNWLMTTRGTATPTIMITATTTNTAVGHHALSVSSGWSPPPLPIHVGPTAAAVVTAAATAASATTGTATASPVPSCETSAAVRRHINHVLAGGAAPYGLEPSGAATTTAARKQTPTAHAPGRPHRMLSYVQPTPADKSPRGASVPEVSTASDRRGDRAPVPTRQSALQPHLHDSQEGPYGGGRSGVAHHHVLDASKQAPGGDMLTTETSAVDYSTVSAGGRGGMYDTGGRAAEHFSSAAQCPDEPSFGTALMTRGSTMQRRQDMYSTDGTSQGMALTLTVGTATNSAPFFTGMGPATAPTPALAAQRSRLTAATTAARQTSLGELPSAAGAGRAPVHAMVSGVASSGAISTLSSVVPSRGRPPSARPSTGRPSTASTAANMTAAQVSTVDRPMSPNGAPKDTSAGDRRVPPVADAKEQQDASRAPVCCAIS